jgi:hypothetical protein
MRILEFAIWERAQTSALDVSIASAFVVSPDAVPVAGRSIQLWGAVTLKLFPNVFWAERAIEDVQ